MHKRELEIQLENAEQTPLSEEAISAANSTLKIQKAIRHHMVTRIKTNKN